MPLHTLKEVSEEARPAGIKLAYEQAEYPAIILIIEYRLDRHFTAQAYYNAK